MLVPLDGSANREGILPYITTLAERLGSELLLVAVINPDALDLPEKFGDVYGKWETAVRQRLSEIVEELRGKGVSASQLVVQGKPTPQILAAVKDHGCDLIAISTKGRGLIGWGMLGSVAYNIFHKATVPVLTIAPGTSEEAPDVAFGISRIAVPLDGSKFAESAIPVAEALAQDFEAEIALVRVIPSSEFLPSQLKELLTGELDEALEYEALEYLQKISRKLETKGHKTVMRVMKGSPGPELVKAINEVPDSLVVMASRGRDSSFAEVLGSTTLAVVRESGEPVLIIPTKG
ncbi:MAG: universal stress protein [Chloroflexi bacterium]|nr:universal stress protein [Chloroflexota bacterium]